MNTITNPIVIISASVVILCIVFLAAFHFGYKIGRKQGEEGGVMMTSNLIADQINVAQAFALPYSSGTDKNDFTFYEVTPIKDNEFRERMGDTVMLEVGITYQ